MKWIFTFLICCTLFTQALFAQRVLSRPDNQKIMYVGLGNPITILAKDINAKNVSLEADNCIIYKEDDHHYSITPKSRGFLILKFKSEGKLIGEEKYTVKPMYKGVASFGGSGEDETSMSVAEVRSQSGIVCRQENFDIQLSYDILSYRIRLIRNAQVIADEMVKSGSYFDQSIKNLLQTIQPNDQLLFSDIRYKDIEIDLEGENIIRSSENPYIRIKVR